MKRRSGNSKHYQITISLNGARHFNELSQVLSFFRIEILICVLKFYVYIEPKVCEF